MTKNNNILKLNKLQVALLNEIAKQALPLRWRLIYPVRNLRVLNLN